MRRTEYLKDYGLQLARRTTRRPQRDDVRGFLARLKLTLSPLDRLPTPDLSQIKASETADTAMALRG
jgi:hypothetical protein